MSVQASPYQEPVSSHPTQIRCPHLLSPSLTIGKSVGMKTGALLNAGEGLELTNLSLHLGHFQLSLTFLLCLFKTLLLGLEVVDVELGIIDVVLAFSISRILAARTTYAAAGPVRRSVSQGGRGRMG
jgi:hypothetical protein